MSESPTVVGIDLGTTYSAIAVINEYGKPEILVNREGERITPSAVFFDQDGPVVGEVAKRSAVANPFRVVQFVKRQIGDKNWEFCIDGEEKYSPEEISAMVIKRLKDDAERLLGKQVHDAVITVPAYFDDAQRRATQNAGWIAGLNVLRIINEPTAAALAYGVGKLLKDQNLLVYDLGGGTFDVTVINLSSEKVKVLATGGSKNLGGCDWDNLLMTYISQQFQKKGGIDLFDEPMLEQDLRDKAEIAKKTLSARDRTNLFLSAKGKSLSIEITRKEFEHITSDLLYRTKGIMDDVLSSSGLTWREIDNVLLVGGATRMKSVREMVEHTSGIVPSVDVNPDEVVALGAAIQGRILTIDKFKKKNQLKKDFIFPYSCIEDVNSHSLGLVALNQEGQELNSIVLHKDTPIGEQVSGYYLTTVDKQAQLHVQVTEGEDIDLDYVKVVGEGLVDLPSYPKGTPIEVLFEYDPDGIIHLSIVDSSTRSRLGEFKINRISNLTTDEIEQCRERIASLVIN
ncbi:MAG: hypothetical protein RLZ12_434 [Bacillota bacterium]|jgi:molecular chaperone DnaK